MVETLSLHTLQLPRGVVVEPVLVQVVVVAAPHVHFSAISIALACVETFVVVAAKHDRLEKWCCAANGWQRLAHLKGQIQNLIQEQGIFRRGFQQQRLCLFLLHILLRNAHCQFALADVHEAKVDLFFSHVGRDAYLEY